MDTTKIGERLLELGKHNIFLAHSTDNPELWELYYSTSPNGRVAIVGVGTLEHALEKGLEVIGRVLQNESKKGKN